MSWGEVFFRLSRPGLTRRPWSGWVLVSVGGLLLIALLSDLATGDPVWPNMAHAAGKESVWVPVWLGWLAFLGLAPERARDQAPARPRDRAAWLWYALYGITILFSLPLKNMTGADFRPAGSAAMMALLMFGIYVFFELAVLMGTPGANAHGDGTLPAGYYGGDWDFLSLMLACEGRIDHVANE